MRQRRKFGSLLRLCGMLLCAVGFVLMAPAQAFRPDSTTTGAPPAVHIDCANCDLPYFITEIRFANFVRDPDVADVQVIITDQPTGGGGTEYTLSFLGRRQFRGLDDTLSVAVKPLETDEGIRNAIVQALKIGLLRYIGKTPLLNRIGITFSAAEETIRVSDRWNNWVFNATLNGFASGQQSSDVFSLLGSFSATRITADLKILCSLTGNYSQSRFEAGPTTFHTFSRGKSLLAAAIFAIDNHWSWETRLTGASSSFTNEELTLRFAPGIEYDLFPYTESTRRQLRFSYHPSAEIRSYFEETIYGVTYERLVGQTIGVALNQVEPWGSAGLTYQETHYLHDLSKYLRELNGVASIHLAEGLSFSVNVVLSQIRNQFSLPRRNATEAEVLLQQSQLETGYSYSASIGLSYLFGSLFSTVINPRFGTTY